MTLPEVNPCEFAGFVTWMYNMSLSTSTTDAITDDPLLLLVRHWVLGGVLLAPSFQNDTFLHFQDSCRHNTKSSWPDIDFCACYLRDDTCWIQVEKIRGRLHGNIISFQETQAGILGVHGVEQCVEGLSRDEP